MGHRWGVSLVSLVTAISAVGAAQQPIPLQRGVSVQMATTRNAVAVPDADTRDALVVALTADGTTYLGGDPVPVSNLAGRVRSLVSTRSDKTLYIKADARVPYARLVETIDAVQTSGITGVTFLTAQQDAADQGQRPVPPKGLEMRVVSR
jgi:biopolymer transport protein ExbD